MEEKNFLGLDWGQEKVGVALAHHETRIALPFAILKNDSTLFGKLSNIVQSENIGILVLGIPTRRHAGEEKSALENVAKRLQSELLVRVELTDEMFTTKLAQQMLLQHGEKNTSDGDDAEAAKILLDGWLEKTGKI